VTPFHKNIARANMKKPKYYFYDNARVKGEEGARLENLVATTLFKEAQFQEDCLGKDMSLYYLSKNGGFEIDFAIVKDGKVDIIIEVKTSDDKLSKNFKLFQKDIPHAKCIQLVKNITKDKILVIDAQLST